MTHAPAPTGAAGAPTEVRGTRERVVRTASRLFAQKGYYATSLHEIAREVGIRKASLFHYFSGKPELLREVLTDCIEPGYRALEEIVRSDRTATEKLERAVVEHVVIMLANQEAVTIFLREGRMLPREQTADFLALRRGYGELFQHLIEEGQASGEFALPDVEQTTLALLGMLNWTAFWYRPGSPRTIDDIAQTLVELALRVVGAEARPRRAAGRRPPSRRTARTSTRRAHA